jgi:hypothetical protein
MVVVVPLLVRDAAVYLSDEGTTELPKKPRDADLAPALQAKAEYVGAVVEAAAAASTGRMARRAKALFIFSGGARIERASEADGRGIARIDAARF